jgi:hypothetical protein
MPISSNVAKKAVQINSKGDDSDRFVRGGIRLTSSSKDEYYKRHAKHCLPEMSKTVTSLPDLKEGVFFLPRLRGGL